MIRWFTSRPAVTLLELLVTILILSILMAMAIPVLQPALENETLREGARLLNTALGMARAKAMETGRSWGVLFEPQDSNPNGVLNLHFVEVQPPYTGDFVSSKMRIHSFPSGTSNEVDMFVSFPAGEFEPATTNDRFRLDYKGHEYLVTGVNWATNIITISREGVQLPVISRDITDGTPCANPDTNPCEPLYAFQFFRRPATSSMAPVQLPGGVAVDLSVSGFNTNPTSGDFPSMFQVDPLGAESVIVTFASNGRLDRVYHFNSTDVRPQRGVRPTQSLHFLVGRPGAFGAENLADLNSIWVSVGYQTGMITSSENACVSDGAGGCETAVTIQPTTNVAEARIHAVSGLSMGG